MNFSAHPIGIEFHAFDAPHLVALGLVALANVALASVRGSASIALRRAIRFALAALILASWVAYAVWRAWSGLWTVQSDLPLHLCDVMALVTAWWLVTQDGALRDFVYFLGAGGAVQALLTSPVGVYGYPHLYFVSSMLAHGAIVTSGVYCALVDGYRPTRRSIRRVAAYGTSYAAVIFLVNLWLGSNYLFIGHKPDFPSLIDWLGPWPWYVPVLIAIGIGLLHVMYLPFAWQGPNAAPAPGAEAKPTRRG